MKTSSKTKSAVIDMISAAQPEIPKLVTSGVIVKALGTTQSKVQLAIRSAEVTPIAIAGRVRIFSEDAIAEVAKELGLVPRVKPSRKGGAQ